MSTSAAVAQRTDLPILRTDLTLYPGPRSSRGGPTWSLHDPSRNRFFRIGWLEFEILARFGAGDSNHIADRVNRETTLNITSEQVIILSQFLITNNLVVVTGDKGLGLLQTQSAAMQKRWTSQLLHSYLFFRIPLVNPDRFLVKTVSAVSWMFSRGFLTILLLMAFMGLYLISRQWESFFYAFSHLFSWQGLVIFSCALAVVKVAHELGHAYSARHFGCRVPSMGVAFLVMWPVLYTDTSEAWKLPSKRQRLIIGASGMLAEITLAVLATLAWNFLPEGPVRSAALFVASTSWVMTLMVNLSPFLRFDGYFLLSDWLEIQNLHERASTLGRWWLRHLLFGWDQPVPVTVSQGQRRFLIGFAYATWLYRLILFLAIGLLVYHFFFKVAGIILLAVEIGWFVLLPIFQETGYWIKERKTMKINAHTIMTGLFLGAFILLIIIPWTTTIKAPAIIRKDHHTRLFSTIPGQIALLNITDGSMVKKGELLVRLISPELEHQVANMQHNISLTQWKLSFQGMNPKLLDTLPIIQQELEASLTEYQGLLEEQKKMSIIAPFPGKVVAVDEHTREGDWIKANEPLIELVSHQGWTLEAYVTESDLGRIALGSNGIFFPEILDWPPVTGRVVNIDTAGTKALNDPYLASIFEGGIPVRKGAKNEWIPETSVYRVALEPEVLPEKLDQLLRGSVILEGTPRSLLSRVRTAIVAVLVRESGF